MFGRLHHDGVACGQCRAPFPGHHQHGKIPGNNLAADSDGFPTRAAEVVAADGDRVALNFVGPATVVAQTVDDERQVSGARIADGFAIVERFEGRQFVEVLFDQIRKPREQSAAVSGVHPGPWTGLEGGARRVHGQIHVRRVPLCHLTDDLLCRRVHRGKGATTD